MDRRFFLAGLASAAFTPGWTSAAEVMPPRIVRTAGGLPAGQIHVVPDHRALYWTIEDGRAIVYPVAIGRAERYVGGVFFVGEKREWPGWTPTAAMIRREPELYAKFAAGVPGGPQSPLGARALYLYRANGRDSLLRIHGTHEDQSIGQPVSNGCVRLLNSHVADLYDRVPLGTRTKLHPFVS